MRHRIPSLLLLTLAVASCGESPTAVSALPRFVGSYALQIDASRSCALFLSEQSFRWRVDAVKTPSGTSFSLPPAEDLQGLDALRLELRADAVGVIGQLSGSLRMDRSYPAGYVVGFTYRGGSGALSGAVQAAFDGRAQVVSGVLNGPITLGWYPFDSADRVCVAHDHSWSLRPI